MSITVRQATEADFDDIRRITRDAYLSAGFIEADNPYVKELENVEDRAKNALVWVAELDGELEFRMLAVDPELQRGGVGRALVTAVIDYARSLEGIHTVSLTSMTPMTSAHALYKSLGFKRVPERDWYVPNEDIILWVFCLEL